MPHASAAAHANHCTRRVASVPQLDRRPWPVRIRTAAAKTNLSPVSKCFAVTLATFFDRNGRWSLSPEQISEATGHGRAQVFQHLSRCKKEGLIKVTSGHASRTSTYSVGPAIVSMAPAEPTRSAVRNPDKPVRNSGPLSIIEAGSQVRTSKRSSTLGTKPPDKRRDPRDDDRITCPKCGNHWARRFGSMCIPCSEVSPDVPGNRPIVTKAGNATDIRSTCGSCGNTWPTKYGTQCKKCGGRSSEAIDRDIAAQERIDRKQADRLQAEIDNRPVTCNRCAYERAKRADLADIGRCAVCAMLTDIEAADLARKGKRLHARMVKAWKERDHIRGKAAADKLTALYAARRA